MRLLPPVLGLVVALVAGCEAGTGDVFSPTTDGAVGASAFTSPWHRPDGQPAVRGEGQERRTEVGAYVGPAHCEWEPAVFLTVGWPLGTAPLTAVDMRQYLRDPEGAVRGVDGFLLGELDLDVEMPAGATDSGYGTEQAELWFGSDGGDTYAYLRTDQGDERWPRTREPIACA